ncbi:glycoside hydrolase family 28 protein [Hymenobacter sp. BT186]|uniref:Glycoside hydrolase family 28 protein n=1 Tax=Hymenobacter telluris TaxID=2816474 RepID=A0A939ETY4_9BACT|nr:glycoside hydrolase family 28 protein [Hymenobacter telluris]MBO0356437.1 glycoside hydrolase family 28 protein [Hymenobacter telluris]MBW3372461.1 glycoside hydrolase family 28 protein [Hymenobacter norwichensis]
MIRRNWLLLTAQFIVLVVLASFSARQPAKRYDIAAYGAVADGQTINTQTIQATIDKCSAAGGGTVVVPKGTFRTGAIFLKRGVNLLIEKDGVLKGSTRPEDYPQVATRWEGTEQQFTAALLNATDLTNVTIEGAGTIDGSGEEWVELARQARLQEKGAVSTTAPRRGRPRLICFQNCRKARIANLKLNNQAVWGLHILYCTGMVVENLTIRAAHNIPSSDGIDVDSSRDVRISGCDIDVNDDCISIKSGKDADGLRVNRPSEDILIEKTRFGYGHGGVAMGSETSGGIRRVTVRNCVAEADNWAPIRFKSQPSRGGVVEDITYRDMVLRNTRQAFEFNMEWRMVPPVAPPAQVLPVVRNVKLINITGTVTAGGRIHGLKDSPIENVSFRNCVVTAQKGLVLENVRGLDTSGLKLTVAEGEAIVRRDAQ